MGRKRIRIDGCLYEAVGRKIGGWDVEVDDDRVSASAVVEPSVPAVGDALCEIRVESFGGDASVTFVVEDEVVAENLTAGLDAGETPEDFVTGRLDKFGKAFAKVLDECAKSYLVPVTLVGSPDYAAELARDFSRDFRRILSQSLR